MKLYAISTSRLQVLESGQFINRFFIDFDNEGLDASTDSEFESLYIDLKEQSVVYNAAVLQVKAKSETETIAKLDLIRDQKITTIRRAVSVFEYTDDPAKRVAYQEARVILKKYNHLEKSNYEAETLGIDKLVTELKNAKFNTVTVLGIDLHIAYLQDANRDFKKVFDSRSTETISLETYDMKALRNAIFTTYKDLTEYVHVMAKRQKTPFFIKTLDVINNGRKYYADILARRTGTDTEQ